MSPSNELKLDDDCQQDLKQVPHPITTQLYKQLLESVNDDIDLT